MFDINTLKETAADDRTIFTDLNTARQAEAQSVSDAMCLATLTGLMQKGLPFRPAAQMVSKMNGHFFEFVLFSAGATDINPETYLLVVLGDQNCRVGMFRDCVVKKVVGAHELESLQSDLKRQQVGYMSFDVALTLEAAIAFVDSNQEGKSDAASKKH